MHRGEHTGAHRSTLLECAIVDSLEQLPHCSGSLGTKAMRLRAIVRADRKRVGDRMAGRRQWLRERGVKFESSGTIPDGSRPIVTPTAICTRYPRE